MHDIVKNYYGKELQSSRDLKTSACCDASTMPEWLKPLIASIHPDIIAKYYGCGLVCPDLLKGRRILDLGCGSGRDVYALAQLAGKDGEVVGVDMTIEQLDTAKKYQQYHADKFGYNNIRFLEGYIEKLDLIDLEPESFDVIVSNCVINLSPDKNAVIKGVHRLLKPGGEFYFSDVYTDRRIPDAVASDPVLYGECIGGALYWNDFLYIARSNGFTDCRLVSDSLLEFNDSVVRSLIGNCRIYSAVYRLFKIDSLERDCEDYGQAVIYKGTIPECRDLFKLDNHHTMETGRVFPVCGNTWKMLKATRFEPHFEFIGNFSTHYGIFPACGGGLPFQDNGPLKSGGCC